MNRFLAFAVMMAGWASAQASELRLVGGSRVQVLAASEPVFESPAEGLWSISCDWRDGWPAEWRHAAPASVVNQGEWTILRGELNACGGMWVLQDSYRSRGSAIQGVRRFEWKGKAAAPRVTLSIRFLTRGHGPAGVLLPGIIYYGNPSGAKSGRVPVYTGAPGEEAIYEEHRYPMPFAYVESRRGQRLWGSALHTLPSPVQHGNLADQWWSLGVAAQVGGTESVLLSGPCASNGHRSVVKAQQRGFVPYDGAWLNSRPGTIVEKTFYLEAFPVEREGDGFGSSVRTSLELTQPYSLDGLPSIAEIVRAKYRFAKSRWHEGVGFAGFRKYETMDRPAFVMGWTGQAEALGYALQVLAAGLRDPQALTMAARSLDFLSTVEFYDGGFRNWYDFVAGKWSGDELLNQGQAMLGFARAISLARRNKIDTRRWEALLRRASGLHSRRILDARWRPLATSEAAFIPALRESSELFGQPQYRQAALKAARHYAERHLSMREPYWGGTLDAQCEDKEAAALAFQAFLALYETTKDAEHLRWARHALDVALTYTFVWDVDFPASRLRDHNFRTRGWTVVSPQNQHVDVWGVIMAPDIYRMGEIEKREDLKRLALLMYRSCGQLIDTRGSQGEQMHHTNYGQRNDPANLLGGRGGYNEQWTVFWITAHFLTGAARFAELGVPVWD